MKGTGIFTGRDMVEMAVQTEENGYRFYSAAAEKAASAKAAELLKWLAEQEKEHERVFRTMLAEPERHEPAEEYAGQKAEFMQAILEARLLPDVETGEKKLAQMTSDDEVLEFALGFEKDTILFMYEMREIVSPQSRETVDKLIAQEMGHVAKLVELRTQLRQD
ncbi:MAG: ferritin family protein [Armatimonadetes bacterium]|nr:ferritin family protein [Armatimonadota bacterium]